MSNVIKLPERTNYDDLIDAGFSHEVASLGYGVGAMLDELAERIERLEGIKDA